MQLTSSSLLKRRYPITKRRRKSSHSHPKYFRGYPTPIQRLKGSLLQMVERESGLPNFGSGWQGDRMIEKKYEQIFYYYSRSYERYCGYYQTKSLSPIYKTMKVPETRRLLFTNSLAFYSAFLRAVAGSPAGPLLYSSRRGFIV